jgi:hypothetical protein
MVYITHPVLGSSACETQEEFLLAIRSVYIQRNNPAGKKSGNLHRTTKG